ncbi:MAG: nucleotidyltransferase domain-containing protein [Oscillospiraceae bacterium]|nr:nucleotidyltransferase domain-containing protein [Oscillospiraceae bacterium]
MTINEIKLRILTAIQDYPVKSIILFGSRAAGTNRDDSDVDLIVEFSQPVTLLTLSGLQMKLEDALKLDVDLVHGPIQPTDLLEIGKEVVLYAA